jgi:DNA modification methylase
MELRSHITNLDRDSFLLFGTLKDNLDPDGIMEEDVIIEALKHFDLIGHIIKTISSTTIEDITAFFEGDYKPKIIDENGEEVVKSGDNLMDTSEHEEIKRNKSSNLEKQSKMERKKRKKRNLKIIKHSPEKKRTSNFFRDLLSVKLRRLFVKDKEKEELKKKGYASPRKDMKSGIND